MRDNSKLLFCIVSMWHKTTSITLQQSYDCNYIALHFNYGDRTQKLLKNDKSRSALFDFCEKKSCVQCKWRAYLEVPSNSNAQKIRCNNFTKNRKEKARANSKSYTLLMNAIFWLAPFQFGRRLPRIYPYPGDWNETIKKMHTYFREGYSNGNL